MVSETLTKFHLYFFDTFCCGVGEARPNYGAVFQNWQNKRRSNELGFVKSLLVQVIKRSTLKAWRGMFFL